MSSVPPETPCSLGVREADSVPLAIEAAALVKGYRATRAVDGLDLAVPAGIIYGLLGPNGAGKTTAVRILTTLTRPDAGVARVCGHDVVREPDAVRHRIGLTGQFASVDEDLTGVENLRLLARLHGFGRAAANVRIDQVVDAFGLHDPASRLVKSYSGGMRRRLDIAASLLVVPDVLFLDEPTTGLDPQSRNAVWDVVRALTVEGTTVLLTTQYLDEADQLAARIAVMDHGRVVAEGTPGALKSLVGAGSLRLRLTSPEQRQRAITTFERLGLGVRHGADPTALSVELRELDRPVQLLLELERTGVAVGDFSYGQPSLDEVFLALTGTKPVATETKEEAAA